MLDIDQSEVQSGILDGEFTDTAEATGTALVPLATTTHWAPKIPLAHADPSFVAHLIATAAHEPQTCGLRRGSLADAQSAYGPHVDERRSVARRTRQII
ncbi:hypothetical protein [uncultured Bradyrhizobium sp.]|uniref:hypothetical protein n=1 Tax=Bradyrhizobium sp. TaxID=376 RepID=UPI0026341D29|nr:hypothetical protein [uncultured Bradyrhizobium sp.]